MIRWIRIGEQITAGELDETHVGRYVVIRPPGSEADVMARLNRVVHLPYRRSVSVELEHATPAQSVWREIPLFACGLDETAPVAIVDRFEADR